MDDAGLFGAELDGAAARLQEADDRAQQLQVERQAQLDARTRDTDTLARLEARLVALRDLQAKVKAAASAYLSKGNAAVAKDDWSEF